MSARSDARTGVRYAVVTGGSRGLGLELSVNLIGRGFVVIVACRSTRDGRERLARRSASLVDGARFVALDLSSLKSVVNFASQLREAFPLVRLAEAASGGTKFNC